MRLDFDIRTSLGFLAGLLGLIEQTVLQVFGFPPSEILVGAFVTLIVGSTAAAGVKGRNGAP